MKKILLPILFLIFTFNNIWGDPNWKIHPTFDEEVKHVVETPRFVYLTSRNMAKNTMNDTYHSLFRFDKEGEEFLSLSTDNLLSSGLINDVSYNSDKGYLFVLFKDFNIDLLYDDGSVTNIPFYEMSSISYPKKVNGIAFDPINDRIYLATDFGYIAINDKKAEIAESRIYGSPLLAFCRLGNKYIAINDGKLLIADSSSPRLNLMDYSSVETESPIFPTALYPLDSQKCLVVCEDEKFQKIKILSIEGEKIIFADGPEGTFYNFENNREGLTVAAGSVLYQFNNKGEWNSINLNSSLKNMAVSSLNLSDFWFGNKRMGLASAKISGEKWTVTKDFMLPDAPAVFISTSGVQHPTKGFLVLNHGFNILTNSLYPQIPLQVSGHNNGRWKNYAPAYTRTALTNMVWMPNGAAVDPDNPSWIYITSPNHGLFRMNIDDPSDVILMSRANDNYKDTEGFVELLPAPQYLTSFANFSKPYFDAKGNLWMNYADYDKRNNYIPQLYCWLAEDRRATTSASNIKLPQLLEVNSPVVVSNFTMMRPLLKTGNGLLVYTPCQHDEIILLIDTKGTPLDASDDKVYRLTDFYDADGNSVDVHQTRCIWEDPATGYVWIGHHEGLFYFIPSQILAGNNHIYRVKVSRNDGTNLADYLLEGVSVNCITADSQGRKWFGTNGAGLVCTSADGREIIMEFNSSNSPLPDDVVYNVDYDSSSNSLIISTDGGLAEYLIPTPQYNSEKTDVRAYPNPVRPDYSNYVTITDIPEGSLVKIADSNGNIVKELGIMSGFEILWDISDTSFRRVKSGVYYILVSPANEEANYSAVGKILVVS